MVFPLAVKSLEEEMTPVVFPVTVLNLRNILANKSYLLITDKILTEEIKSMIK